MQLSEICLVADRAWAETTVDVEDQPVSRRQFEAWDDFVQDVATATKHNITGRVVERWPDELQGRMLLVPTSEIDRLAERGGDPTIYYNRTILLGTGDSPRAARRLDALGVAGAISAVQYAAWRAQRLECLPIGLFGLSSVGAQIGAKCESTYMATDRYCILDAEDSVATFTELVGTYARSYAATRLG
jgi:hypothetical protein